MRNFGRCEGNLREMLLERNGNEQVHIKPHTHTHTHTHTRTHTHVRTQQTHTHVSSPPLYVCRWHTEVFPCNQLQCNDLSHDWRQDQEENPAVA